MRPRSAAASAAVASVQPRERGCVTEIGLVAEDCDCVREARRSSWEARESEGNGAGHAVSAQLPEAGDIGMPSTPSPSAATAFASSRTKQGVPAARLVKRDTERRLRPR